MTRESEVLSVYRPRFLTLIALMAVAAPVALANSSHDAAMPQAWPQPNLPYGWPLSWYWCEVKAPSRGAPPQINLEFVRWSAPRLAANLAICFAMLAVLGVACQWLLWRYGPPWRFRPRLVTLFVLMVVAAPAVLANLSPGDFEAIWGGYKPVEYGWPLSWYWRNLIATPPTRLACGAL